MKPLDADKLRELARKRLEVEPARKSNEWMNPLNKLIWRKAFTSKQTEVTLKDGSQFVVEYEPKGKPGKAWIRPANKYQFAPCGWFDIKEVKYGATWVTKP